MDHSPPSRAGPPGEGGPGRSLGHGQIFLETRRLTPGRCCSVCVRWKRLLHLRAGLEVAASLLWAHGKTGPDGVTNSAQKGFIGQSCRGNQREQFRRHSCKRWPAQRLRAVSTEAPQPATVVSMSPFGFSGVQPALPDQEPSALAHPGFQRLQLLAVDTVSSTHDDHDRGQGGWQAALSLELPQDSRVDGS